MVGDTPVTGRHFDLNKRFAIVVSAEDAVTTEALVRAVDTCSTIEVDGEWVIFV